MTLLVNEIFGPTLQGEGRSQGRPAAFLRVAACNLSCSWCDTAYTWDFAKYDKEAEVHRMEPGEAAGQVLMHLPPARDRVLVISGGEPMLQQHALVEVLDALPPNLEVEFETAGTIPPTPMMESFQPQYTVSPKLEHSGNAAGKREVPLALRALSDTGRAAWKFVVQHPDQLPEVDALVTKYQLVGPVYIMPEGTEPAVLRRRAQALVGAVIDRGYRLTGRLHIDLWGLERGR